MGLRDSVPRSARRNAAPSHWQRGRVASLHPPNGIPLGPFMSDEAKTQIALINIINLYQCDWREFCSGFFDECPEHAELYGSMLAIRHYPHNIRRAYVNEAWYNHLRRKYSGFTSDAQCTMVPDGEHRKICIFHDFLYWRGGDEIDRKAADLFLNYMSDQRVKLFKSRIVRICIDLWGNLLAWGTQRFGRSHFNFKTKIRLP